MDHLEAATCLALHMGKTVVVPLWNKGIFETRRHIVDSVPRLSQVQVCDFGKYLGLFLGPGAAAVRWDPAKEKYWARCLDAKATNGGFFEALRHYHVYGVSVLSFIMQLVPVSAELLGLERRAVQNLTRGPWHAIPGACLAALKDLGFPLEVRSLKLINMAAMFRVSEACSNFDDIARSISEQPTDLDARLRPQPPSWAKDSIVMGLIRNREQIQAIAPYFLATPLYDIQSRLFLHLRSLVPSPWCALLRRRALRHIDFEDVDPAVIITNIKKANSEMPAKMVFSALKVLCNGLPTSRRLQLGLLPCPICDGDEGDCTEHLIHCGPLIVFLVGHFPCIGTLLGPMAGVSRSLLNRSLSRDQLIATVTGHDLLVHCLSALYLGGRGAPPEMLLEARLRAICRKAPAVARLLRAPPPHRIVDF
jgi:hypothetical protein